MKNYKTRRSSSERYATRRGILKSLAAASVLGSGMGAVNGKMGLIGSALASSGNYSSLTDYKALVCVFLYGGSDSFNMFVPTDDDAYQRYATSRGSLSVAQDALLQTSTGAGIGFNPFMPNSRALFDQGKLAVVSNVGNLIKPVTRQDYADLNDAIPADLFAHNHQQEQWLKGLSSMPSSLVNSGWGGRMADLLQDANSTALPPTFSLAGSNHWLPGQASTPLSLNSSDGLEPIYGMNPDNYYDAARSSVLSRVMGISRNHQLEAQVAGMKSRSISSANLLLEALDGAPDLTTPYDGSSKLAQQLRMVARLIQSRSSLSMQRQIFFVGLGGWDTHDNQGVRLNLLMSELDTALSDFYATLGELGQQDNVTTFTASDFGRTLSVNGDGSDHGWGGHYMAMGGAVNGGQLHGQLPTFVTGAEDDADDKGRVIPEISVNQMGASLGSWMGLSDSDLTDIFPDLENFGSDWQSNLTLFG